MKRLPIFLLGLSLVANAALVWKVAASKSANSAPPVASAKLETSASTATSAESTATAASGTLTDLRVAPLPQLVAQLRAQGFGDGFITAILHQRLRAERQAELAALDDSAELEGVWWRTANANNPERKARQAKRAEITAQIQAEVNAALGLTPKGPSTDPRFAFLSEDKIAAVKRIEKEYQEVTSSAIKGGFTRESKSLIESEKKADLANLLTPQELAEYELRFSSTADQMRHRVTAIEATEAEYRSLYKLHQTFEAEPGNVPGRTPNEQTNQESAGAQLRAQIIAALGPERGGEYIWSGNGDYQNIKQASAQLSLPATTALEVMTLREEIGAQGMAIARDRQRSNADKVAALNTLAATARQRLNTLLPANVQEQIPPRSLNWVSELANGRVMVSDPLRNSSSSFQVTPQPPPKR